jgi:hypothetical protein
VDNDKRDVRRLGRTEIKFRKYTAGNNSLDHKRNEDTLEEFKVDPV